MEKRIYLDNAATTPVDPQVVEVMRPFWSDSFGNPGAIYEEGREARKVLNEARTTIAGLIGAVGDEIIFTSGGTESNNLAVLGSIGKFLSLRTVTEGNPTESKLSDSASKRSHIITTKIEHKSVLAPCEVLEKRGYDVTYLGVDKEGIIDLRELKEALRAETVLVSIMYANNEIGAIQPIAEIAKIIKKFRKDTGGKYPLLHTDACQVGNYLDMDVHTLGVDLMTINGSKIYGPKGIGCLYVKKPAQLGEGVNLTPILYGGGQERNLRSGTEDIPLIVGFAEAFKIARAKREAEAKRLSHLQNYFIDEILKKVPRTFLNGSREARLPNNINISILGVEGESLVLYLDSLGVAAATGSACNSQNLEGSYVIKALGKNPEHSHGSLRISMGKDTTKEDIDYLLKTLPEVVAKLRSVSAIRK